MSEVARLHSVSFFDSFYASYFSSVLCALGWQFSLPIKAALTSWMQLGGSRWDFETFRVNIISDVLGVPKIHIVLHTCTRKNTQQSLLCHYIQMYLIQTYNLAIPLSLHFLTCFPILSNLTYYKRRFACFLAEMLKQFSTAIRQTHLLSL